MTRLHPHALLAAGALALAALGCGLSAGLDDPAPLDGPLYWAAVTDTPVPTVTVWLGTTTPVYADTPVPVVLTTTPQWTTVTPTPPTPAPTATPIGWWTATPTVATPTPIWVTTTPAFVTSTPPPPVTTTPGLPRIGFTTPAPLPTAYYRVGTFYMQRDVTVGGPDGLVLRLVAHATQPSPDDPAATWHRLTVRLTNRGDAPLTVVPSDLFFIRHVVRDDGTVVTGRWTAANAPLIAAGLPDYAAQQLAPLAPGATRDVVLGFVLPNGTVETVGLMTAWQQAPDGGVPVWFYLTEDPRSPLVDADGPPPPTPVVLGDGTGAPGGGDDDAGGGLWPTTGSITRGYGCHALYTGVDGSGFGCPAEQPWFHNGVDIANASGTAVWSPVDGTLVYAGPDSYGADCSAMAGSEPPHAGLGNYQKVTGATTTHYLGHLSGFALTSGAVTAGQTTAALGSSGCSTGPHLHWIVYDGGQLVDPALWAGPGP